LTVDDGNLGSGGNPGQKLLPPSPSPLQPAFPLVNVIHSGRGVEHQDHRWVARRTLFPAFRGPNRSGKCPHKAQHSKHPQRQKKQFAEAKLPPGYLVPLLEELEGREDHRHRFPPPKMQEYRHRHEKSRY
jgi:hypothetical protein